MCVCFSCGSQACGVCLMDTNHYCQTQHYNKQSALSSGGEAGVWVGGGGLLLVLCCLQIELRFISAKKTGRWKKLIKRRQDAVSSFIYRNKIQRDRLIYFISEFYGSFSTVKPLLSRRVFFVESRQEYGQEDIFSRRCKPTCS